MERKLVNVAIANAFFEERKNLMDTYFPFVLKTFENKTICTIGDISQNIKGIFDIDLPINSIKNILTKNNEVFQIQKETKAHWTVSLSKDGKNELTELIDNENRAERRILSFYTFIKEFAEQKFETKYDIEKIRSLVDSFVSRNLYSLSIERIDKNGETERTDDFERILVYCLTYLNSHNPEYIEIFDEIWKGSIIWNELKKESFEDSDNKLKKHLTIFIDTNFALSLLELHNPIINKAAKELYQLIKGINNITLAVLDITINEIYDLLDLYDLIKDNFTDIEIDSAFYYLKQRGYSSVQTERLKDNIESELAKFGIRKQETAILQEREQKNYATIYDHLFERRTKSNEKRSEKAKKQETAIEKSTHHDTSVILHILRQKDRYARNFENSKSIFLTSSFNLYRNYGAIHKKLESFPSVILDTTLTNILYLKNPQKSSQISLSQIIKTHCNYLIVDQGIWNSYLSIIKDLKKEDKISVDDYTRLITKNQITQEYLLNADTEKINEVEIKEVLNKIKEVEDKKDAALSEKEKLINELTENNKKLIGKVETISNEKEISEQQLLSKQAGERESLQEQIDHLKFESGAKDYIEEQLEKNYYPLIWLLLLNIIVFVSVLFLFFLSDLIISDDFIKEYQITTKLALWLKAGCSIGIFVLSAFLSKIYRKDFWDYIFTRRKLKRRLKEKHKEEFKQKTVANRVDCPTSKD